MLGRQLHPRHARRHERHGGIHHQLAGDVRGNLVEDRSLAFPRHRDDDDLGRLGGVRVGGATRAAEREPMMTG
jgi:hypothetical protein